jgi:hypothetical protein
MQTIKSVLSKFDPVKDKYVSREFQTFGLKLAEDLDDYKHRSLYMKLAKTIHRSILEQALSFAVDSTAKNKGALFMWKLKQLKGQSSKLKVDEKKKKL